VLGARRRAVCVCCFILMSVYYAILFGPRVGVCLSVSVSLSVCPVVSCMSMHVAVYRVSTDYQGLLSWWMKTNFLLSFLMSFSICSSCASNSSLRFFLAGVSNVKERV